MIDEKRADPGPKEDADDTNITEDIGLDWLDASLTTLVGEGDGLFPVVVVVVVGMAGDDVVEVVVGNITVTAGQLAEEFF